MNNILLEKLRSFGRFITSSRVFFVMMIVCALFIVLIANLFRIQIVKGDEYKENYTQLSITTLTEKATRGNIYDRNGVLLAYNELTYAVTITDTGNYSNGYEWNEMLLELVEILDKNNAEIVTSFPMAYDDNGDLIFITTSDSEKNTLLMNVYGISSIDSLDSVDNEGNIYYRSDPEPQEFLDIALERFGIGYYADGGTYEVDKDTALKMLNIRYSIYLVSYMRYHTVTVASDVSQNTVTDILEHSDTLLDVSIAEDTTRVYTDSECFSGILGYTGVASEEILAQLQEEDDSYESGDVVGRAGIEQAMELELSGTKGTTTVIVDSVGRVMETLESTEAVAGDDVYLTIDHDLQVAVYYMLEQMLASVILEHMVNAEVNTDDYNNTSKIEISIYDVYFQMINNNVISITKFFDDGASDVEKTMYKSFLSEMEREIQMISSAMKPGGSAEISDNLRELLDYCVDYLEDSGVVFDINSNEHYKNWYNGNISFYALLENLSMDGDIDMTGLDIDTSYAETENVIEAISKYINDFISSDTGFAKLIYKILIYDRIISGAQILLAMYYQGVLSLDDYEISELYNGSLSAYSVMYSKIDSLEITPAQIALDPCTAACVVLDVDTGDPLAVVSYPGYDLNQMSGTVDADYYSSLLNDMSNPLYNNATQTRVAPGSTYKAVTATAALEEGVITDDEEIEAIGIFTEAGMNLKCWYYPSQHGLINLRKAVMVSCNYFFCELGYRLSLDKDGDYDDEQGIEILTEYSKMYGLDSASGIEIEENAPSISDYSAIASAIGQGTHAYTCISLARYAMTLANYGTLYDLTLLDHRTDYEGNLLETYSAKVANVADISTSTFDTVRDAMNAVVNTDGSCEKIFEDCVVDSAGKTGTAEESSVRAPHANYIGFAPYEDPEIAYAIVIPYGYTSAYSAQFGCELLNYYFGNDITLEDILAGGAMSLSGVTVND